MSEESVELSEFGFNDTLLELSEDKIRAVVKKEFGIVVGRMYASDTDIGGDAISIDTGDLEGADSVVILIGADKNLIGGEVKFSRWLYISCDLM